MRSSRGLSPTGSSSRKFDGEIKQENIKLVSVSPFRAVIRVQEDEGDQDDDHDDDDLEAERHDDSELGIHRQPLNQEALNTGYRAQSPIKEDSQVMRNEREQYLQNFNSGNNNNNYGERKTPRQGAQSSERIKKESELLRIQRENFLNGFQSSPPQT